MKNAISAEYVDLLVTTHGREVAKQLEGHIPDALTKRVPQSWMEIVNQPGAASLRALLEPAVPHLPRFVEYLTRFVEGAAVIEAYGAPALVIALPNWAEEGMELHPGFCWMGLPTNPGRIEKFIDQVGPIPASLESLWRVANFVNTKHPSNICSLEPLAHDGIEAPEVFLEPSRANPTAPPFECLKIAVTNHQMITCMTRPPGQKHWDDMLVERFRHTGELSYGVKGRLDSMLADSSFADWEPQS